MSLRRLGAGKPTGPKKQSIFRFVPKMISIGIIVAAIAIVAIIKYDSQPPKIKNTTQNGSTLAYAVKGSTRVGNQTLNPEQISPDSNDMAIFLVNKFFETIPPPSPDCQAVACVALTFDDGPNADSTAIILGALERNFAHATFFAIGNKVSGNEALLKRMQDDGNDIGNHSWSHKSFLKLTPEQIKQEISQTQQVIAASGVPPPHLLRPPYGDFLLSMQKDVKQAIILWNVDPKDWSYNDPAKIAAAVEQQIRPGAIIVMHDKLATANAVNRLLIHLGTKYRFVTVSELLNLQPNSKGAYIGR